MGNVIRFPCERRYAPDVKCLDVNLKPATVIILPVIRIERDTDAARTLKPVYGNARRRRRRRVAP